MLVLLIGARAQKEAALKRTDELQVKDCAWPLNLSRQHIMAIGTTHYGVECGGGNELHEILLRSRFVKY